MPRCAAASRTTCDAPGEIVVESTGSRGAAPARESTPVAPSTTCLKSSEPPTIVNTMSRSARSAGESTIVAPSSASASALLRVRLQTATSCPAAEQAPGERDAHAAGADPADPHPVVLAHLASTACKRLQDGIPDRLGRQARAGGRRSRAWLGAVGVVSAIRTGARHGRRCGSRPPGHAPRLRYRHRGGARRSLRRRSAPAPRQGRVRGRRGDGGGGRSGAAPAWGAGGGPAGPRGPRASAGRTLVR